MKEASRSGVRNVGEAGLRFVANQVGGQVGQSAAIAGGRELIGMADAFGILPEMLVDEDYYFSKCGMAGYRVMFAAYRKGVSLAELTYCAGQSGNPAYQYSWYHLWYMFFKGSFTIQKNMNIQHLTTILKLCHERLDVPIGSLLGKQLHTKATHTGFYGELTELLMGLDNRGCALVAGITKPL